MHAERVADYLLMLAAKGCPVQSDGEDYVLPQNDGEVRLPPNQKTESDFGYRAEAPGSSPAWLPSQGECGYWSERIVLG